MSETLYHAVAGDNKRFLHWFRTSFFDFCAQYGYRPMLINGDGLCLQCIYDGKLIPRERATDLALLLYNTFEEKKTYYHPSGRAL